MESILTTSNITKIYKNVYAVNNININIHQGDIYGLVGRNGAGKTTLMKMIAGLAKPTSGNYKIFGHFPEENKDLLKRVGCLIEAPGVYPNMTAKENLKQKCILLGVNKKDYINGLLETVGLGNVGNKRVNQFSLGMRQRLGIALALIGEPDLLILDEPINGLDPQGIVQMRDMIINLNKERNITFLISSHILEELSKICTRFGFVNNGVLVEEDTVEELFDKCSDHVVIKTNTPEKACLILDSINVTDYKVVTNDTIRVFGGNDKTAFMNSALVSQGVEVKEIHIEGVSIEEYFLNITGGTDR